MATNETQGLLRIYLSSTDKDVSKPVYTSIVEMAKESDVAGATVLKGVLGYKIRKPVSTAEISEGNDKFPIVIEIVDDHDKLISFVKNIESKLDTITKGILVTIEDVHVLLNK